MYTHTEFLAIVWTLWSLALTTTIARVVIRLRIQRKFYAEDYFAVLAMVFLTTLSAVVTAAAPIFEMTQAYLIAAAVDPETPLPLPAAEFTAHTIRALKLMFAQMLLFWSTLWAGKFSLLVFFRHMVVGIPRYMHIWWGVFTLVLLTYLACMLSNFLTCVPLDKYWSATGCSSPDDLKRSGASIKFATGVDIAADFLVMLLPLRLLVTLQISLKQKLGLAGLFSLGIIVIVFAFVRLFKVTRATALSQTDPTTLADGPIILSLWSTIEAAVSVIVANLPAFRSLLRNKGNTGFSKSKGERSTGYPTQITSKITASQSAIVSRNRGYELESLSSFDGDSDGKSRGRIKDIEGGGKGEIVMTRQVSVQSRQILVEETPQTSRTNFGRP
ncbi:hypothetical protein D0Z07_5941 [Hyphodiscus hymeniophilus]|uniref:Rhodopsin domain-containing protein n=1 Tax=Hyphodiscus hymeniophilus TaxID=353542 RepID=A0A9P6VHH7_9HELO|nr:hypothetical protein D0Z07_5941 [Hyphodiscus hymeniophilus]